MERILIRLPDEATLERVFWYLESLSALLRSRHKGHTLRRFAHLGFGD